MALCLSKLLISIQILQASVVHTTTIFRTYLINFILPFRWKLYQNCINVEQSPDFIADGNEMRFWAQHSLLNLITEQLARRAQHSDTGLLPVSGACPAHRSSSDITRIVMLITIICPIVYHSYIHICQSGSLVMPNNTHSNKYNPMDRVVCILRKWIRWIEFPIRIFFFGAVRRAMMTFFLSFLVVLSFLSAYRVQLCIRERIIYCIKLRFHCWIDGVNGIFRWKNSANIRDRLTFQNESRSW